MLDELSFEELRRMMLEKRKAERQARLEHFWRTGRVALPADQPRQIAQSGPRATAGEPVEAAGARRRRRRISRKPWMDRVLLLVEISAVLGLLFILFNGFNLLRTLNREVSEALAMPGLTPTALIQAVILPSGHTPPNAPGGVQPNEAEIPEHLRPIVQSMASLTLPTQGPEQALRIQIPAIGVDAPIVLGDGWEQLKKGVGQHPGTPNPGQEGNIVLSAHNDVFGEIFRDLDKLKEGDNIILFSSQRTYTYIVGHSQVVEPTRVDVMAPTSDAVMTLISCYPYMVSDKRIVVRAALQN
jgi:sortase A